MSAVRETPRYELEHGYPFGFVGQCRTCGYRTARVSTAGMVASFMHAHGEHCEGAS